MASRPDPGEGYYWWQRSAVLTLYNIFKGCIYGDRPRTELSKYDERPGHSLFVETNPILCETTQKTSLVLRLYCSAFGDG